MLYGGKKASAGFDVDGSLYGNLALVHHLSTSDSAACSLTLPVALNAGSKYKWGTWEEKTLQRLFPKYVFFFFLGLEVFFHLFCSPLKPFFVLHPSNEVFLPRLQSGEVQGDFFLRTSFDKVGSKTALQEYSALIKTDLVRLTTKQIPNIHQK